jgi:hypothetical protein
MRLGKSPGLAAAAVGLFCLTPGAHAISQPQANILAILYLTNPYQL